MLVLAGWTAAWSAQAQTGSRLPTVTSFDIPIAGLSATIDRPEPVIPKNTDSGVLVVVRAGDRVLATQEVAEFLGGPFEVQAELSGPGLERTITVPQLALSDPPPEDPLVLRLPPLPMAGDYALANVRLVRDGKPVLDATPLQFTVKVIDQVLITSVKTRPLTLDEIRDKGIVLSSDDYVGFEFTLGMATESQSVSFSLPVAFDRQGVPVPAVIKPPSSPPRAGVSVAQDLPEPLIVPTLLEVEDLKALNIPDFDGTLRAPSGEPIRIPSVLVIPGNVGYLKQFFSAQLFVANGAPVGSGLTVRDVQGTVKLPAGADRVPGSADDPLVLPETVRGVQPETLPVRGVGLDGVPDTADDTVVLKAAEQGQAEFLIRGEQEGFHSIEFDIAAVLDGLPIGPVDVRGKARGGVLVRNPFFDMTFTIPSVVRAGEPFSVFATVNHIGKGIANDLSVALTAASLSGARAAGDLEQRIPTLLPGDARTLEYRFVAQRTGQVVATYLKLDTSAPGAGKLKWSLGVGERGVALSPDTLVLPAGVDGLPREVVAAAMRVLGQAWSISNAAAGTLPPDVLRIPRSVTTARALALAEAGLRVSLGQDPRSAARDLAFDFYGGEPLDAAFDQLLRETQAGHAFARAVGTALASEMHAAGGLLPFGQEIDAVAESGADFLRFAVGSGSGAPPVEVTLLDDVGRRSDAPAAPDVPPVSEIAGAVWIPMGATSAEALVGLLTQVNSPLYTLELKGTGPGVLDLSLTQPRGDGSFVRGELTAVPVTAATRARLLVDRRRPETLVLEVDANGDGSYESSQALRVEAVASSGPQLVSASVVGPETIDGASPFGFQVAVLFDRIVDADSAAVLDHYVIPQNGMQSAQRQLSGRFVFGSLEQPEGPYVPSTLAVSGMRDQRGVVGPSKTVELVSTLEDPGAVISGRVVGPDGGAVTTGTVTYQNNSNWECLPSLFEQESSPIAAGFAAVELDGQGRYEFRYVRQDACGFPWILATRDPRTGSLQRASGFVSTAGEHVVLDFALLGQGVVRGTVRDLRGNVVSGAQVAVVSQTDPQVGGVTTTDGSGRYTVYGITVGQVSVTAAKGTGVGRASGNVGRAGGTASVDVTLDGSATSVAGQVRIVEGVEQREGVGVTVVYEAKGTTIAVTQTDRAGAFSFENVPAGPFTLKAALNTRDSAKIHGTAVAGQPLTGQVLVIHVPVAGAPQPGPGYGSVQGLVSYADGVPASDVVVSIAGRGVVSAADGSFEIPGVPVDPSAPHTVLAQSRDGLRSGQAQVYVTQSEQIVEGVVVVLSGLGSAEFRVLDSKGAPLVGQEVGLLGRCKAACGCNPATTDSHGMARFDGLPIGAVHARAVRAGTGFADVASASASITRDGEVATGTLQFAGAGSVSGVVRDAAGSPVFGADVVLRSKVFVSATCSLGHGVAQRVRTNTRGEYRFRAVNLGPVSVTASQTFLPVPVSATDVLTVPGQELALDLTLLSGDASFAGQLSGTVLLPDGVTPAGAGIEVTADGVLPDVVVSTDAVGHFAFAKILPEGRYTLTARDPVTGGVAKTAVFLRANQDAQQNLRLLGRGVVRVSVQDAAGLPVDNAFVRVREAGFTGGLHEGAVEASNLGVVRFENVFEGPLSIEASDVFGRGGRASALLADPGTTLDVTVRLSMTGSVAGIFVAADGATPVPFGAVTLTAGGRVIGRTTTTGSGRDVGRFRFDHVPAGAVRVDAQDPSTARTGFALGNIERQDQIVELTLRAHGLGTVEGLVSGDGRPQPGAEVTLIAGPLGAHTVADAQGRYRVTGIPEGEVAVTASLGNGFLVGTAAAHLMGDGSTLELNVRLRSSGRVLGRVLNADGLTPAPPSIVSIRVGGAGGGEQSTLTDDAGRFVFDRVPAGSANLSVDVLGSPDRGIATLTVPSGGQVESLVELHGVGRLSGQALGPGGPAAGTLVVSGTGDATYSQTVAVGPDGSFVFPELLAGPFIASLTVSGLFPLYGSATGEILPDRDNSIEVRVQPSGTLGGRVVRSDGAPARGTEIRLDLLPNRGRRVLYARDDGSFEAAGVPLGAFTLHFRDPFTGGVAMMGSRLAQDKQALDVGVVTLDDTPVEAVAFVPADGATQVAVNAPIEVYFSDPLRSPQGITVSDGTSTLLARPQLSADGLKVTLRGRWTDASLITVTATEAVTDIHGRHPREPASASFRTVDLSPPRVASVVPIDGAIEVAPASSIEISFDEPLDPTASVLGVVTLSDGTSTLAGTTASPSAATLTFAPAALLLDDTRYTVRVNGARDPSGNLQTQAFTSTFATHDSQPPALSLSRPASGSWVNSARPRIVVDVTDSLSGVDPDSATLFVDGSQVQPSASPSQIRFTPSIDLADGQLAIEASIGDRAGNQASPLLEAFSIDTVAPEPAQLAGILNGAVLVGRVAFSATAADTGSGVARIRLLADDQPVMELERPFQGELDSSALADGPHALTARAVDQAGNVGPAGTPVEVTVDNRPIEVRITKPVANSRWRDTVHVSATPSEPVKRLVFSAGTSTVIDEAPPYQATLDLAGAPEGTAIITVTAVGLLDETAANTQTIIVDRTPPAPPDVTRIFAEPPDNGLSLVYGVAGAVESRATVNATNPATAATASSRASADGSFALFLEASVGDAVSLVAVDEAGNASAPSTVIVRATTTLPPAVATLRFLGSIVDRVGQGPAALAPDGQKDAVFELEFALGAGITRQLSFVDLQGPALRSTRVDVGSVLGVSEPDLGAPFLNEADGHVDLTISDNASFLLFAAREGLIQQGARYTATAVFTNGSRYIGELTLELPKHEVTSGTFGIANQALPSSISPGPPREEVASGVFALSNKHLLFPIGGTPGESHPAEAVSAVVSVKNGQLPVRVGGAPGVLQPTEAVSPIVSVRNVSLPPKPVDASGTPLVSEAVSPVVSLRNTLLPSVSVDPSGQSLPVEAVSSMVSVRNASLPVASDSSLSSEAVSQTVSVHNDPTAPPTIFPAAAQARGLGTQELGPGAPAANVPTSPAAGIGGGGVQNCPAGAGPCVAAFVRCPADAAACRPHTGFAGSGPIAGASMTWGAGLASDASTSVRRAGDASVDAGTAADGGTTTVSDAATNREVSP